MYLQLEFLVGGHNKEPYDTLNLQVLVNRHALVNLQVYVKLHVF